MDGLGRSSNGRWKHRRPPLSPSMFCLLLLSSQGWGLTGCFLLVLFSVENWIFSSFFLSWFLMLVGDWRWLCCAVVNFDGVAPLSFLLCYNHQPNMKKESLFFFIFFCFSIFLVPFLIDSDGNLCFDYCWTRWLQFSKLTGACSSAMHKIFCIFCLHLIDDYFVYEVRIVCLISLWK